MEMVCLFVWNQNYITTDIIIPLIIYITYPTILFSFKSQLLRKLFYIINILST